MKCYLHAPFPFKVSDFLSVLTISLRLAALLRTNIKHEQLPKLSFSIKPQKKSLFCSEF